MIFEFDGISRMGRQDDAWERGRQGRHERMSTGVTRADRLHPGLL